MIRLNSRIQEGEEEDNPADRGRIKDHTWEKTDFLPEIQSLECFLIRRHSNYLCVCLFNCYCLVWKLVYRVYCL